MSECEGSDVAMLFPKEHSSRTANMSKAKGARANHMIDTITILLMNCQEKYI